MSSEDIPCFVSIGKNCLHGSSKNMSECKDVLRTNLLTYAIKKRVAYAIKGYVWHMPLKGMFDICH